MFPHATVNKVIEYRLSLLSSKIIKTPVRIDDKSDISRRKYLENQQETITVSSQNGEEMMLASSPAVQLPQFFYTDLNLQNDAIFDKEFIRSARKQQKTYVVVPK